MLLVLVDDGAVTGDLVVHLGDDLGTEGKMVPHRILLELVQGDTVVEACVTGHEERLRDVVGDFKRCISLVQILKWTSEVTR